MITHEIDLSGLSVCIGIPSSRDMHPLVVKSLFATKDICYNNGIRCNLALVYGNAVVQWARDEVANLLLESDSNRFFFIDSDIVWEPDAFMRMLALSKVRDIICASYPAKKDQPTFYIRYEDSKPLVADEYGLVEIKGAGLGFTVVKREIMEQVRESATTIYDEISKTSIPSIFKVGTHNGNRRGEDMAFFETLHELGHTVYLDPSISLGHIGTKVYRGSVMDAMNVE